MDAIAERPAVLLLIPKPGTSILIWSIVFTSCPGTSRCTIPWCSHRRTRRPTPQHRCACGLSTIEPDGFDVAEDEPGEDGEFAGDLDHICGMLDGTFAEDIDFRLHFLDDGGDAIWFNPAEVALIAINEEFIGQRDEHGRPIDASSDDVIGTDEEREREASEERAE